VEHGGGLANGTGLLDGTRPDRSADPERGASPRPWDLASREQTPQPSRLSGEHLTAAAAGEGDHALICLLFNGPRLSEACSTRVDDLGTSRDHVTVRITRKGGGDTLDRHGAARFVRRLARRPGLPPTNPHAPRHAFVAAALDTGVPSETPETRPDTPTLPKGNFFEIKAQFSITMPIEAAC
jgi:hypothetical protein